MRYFVIGLILALSLFSCRDSNLIEKNDRIVASIYGKNLYQSDLHDVLYKGISASDSIVRTRAFIEQWIRRELIIHQAEQNLSENELDFSKQIQDYRNSLVIYKYESKLIEQKLDTIVSDTEILDYYNSNSGNFKLNKNVVRIASVEIESDDKRKWQFIKLLRDYDELLIDSIGSMAEKYCENYDINVERWRYFDEVIEEYGLDVKDELRYLEKNKFIKIEREGTTCLLRICDYRTIGDDAPAELEKVSIRYIILNMRKKKLIEEMNNSLFNKAVEEHVFEIF
ncbi:MAG: hypothetical protein ACI358_06990 [Candidatus Limimorpha sp.]